jgi:hypothetical protein
MNNTGNRDPYTPEEQIPVFETIKMRHTGQPWQVRYNFTEDTITDPDMPTRRTFNYLYADVEELTVECLSGADIPPEFIMHIIE